MKKILGLAEENIMREKFPKRWFLIPLPTAILISYAIWLVRMWIDDPSENVVVSAFIIAIIGAYSFPIGLPGAILVPQTIITANLSLFSCLGYILYVALSITGYLKQTRWLFIPLCVLLLLNMAGCQMERTVKAIPFDM